MGLAIVWCGVLVLVVAILLHACYAYSNISSLRQVELYLDEWGSEKEREDTRIDLNTTIGDLIRACRAIQLADESYQANADIRQMQTNPWDWEQKRNPFTPTYHVLSIDGYYKCVLIPGRANQKTLGSGIVEWVLLKFALAAMLVFLVLELLRFRVAFKSSPLRTWRRSCNCLESLKAVRDLLFGVTSIRVQMEVARARSEYARRCLMYAKPVLLVWYSLQVLRLNSSHFWFRREYMDRILGNDDGIIEDVLGNEFLGLFIILVTFIALARGSSRPSPGALNAANCVMSVVWIWRLTTLSYSWYRYYSPFFGVCRIFQGMMFGNSRLTMALQSLITVVDTAVFLAFNFGNERHPDSNHLPGLILGQTITFLLSCCVFLSFEHLLTSEAKLLIKAKDADKASALAYSLLSSMTDAVVHLDANFCIAESCPKLSSLMLSASTGGEILGKRVVNFLQEEDRERFDNITAGLLEETLAERPGASRVRVLHCHLLDNKQSPFPVQLFIACILDDYTHYVMGIKEEGDERPPTMVEERPCHSVTIIPEINALQFMARDTTTVIQNKIDALTFSVQSASLNDNASFSSSSGESSDESSGFLGSDIWVCVDIATPALNVLCSSFAFDVFNSGKKCKTLVELFSAVDAISVASFVLDSFVSEGHNSQRRSLATVTKLGRLVASTRIKVFEIDEITSRFEGHDCKPVCVLFTDIQYVTKRKKTKKEFVVLVRVRDLRLRWHSQATGPHRAMVAGRHAFRQALVHPMQLVKSLQEQISACILNANAGTDSQLPCELGAFQFEPHASARTSSFVEPWLDVALLDLQENADYALLSIAMRFSRLTSLLSL